MTTPREKAVGDVFAELQRAETIHPGWPANAFCGLTIIGEEYGEACQAAIESHFRDADPDLIYSEVLSIAATAMRWAMDYKSRQHDRQAESGGR